MHYDTLSRNTVKITLTRKDMKDYSLRSENIRSHSAESKRSLTGFLKKFRSEISLFPGHSAERLFLEAFPSDDGGCVLYVSTLGTEPLPPSAPERKTAELMCRTDTLDDAARLCRSVRSKVRRSALYTLDGSYCLIIKVSDSDSDRLTHTIEEFGGLSDDPVDIAYITEHGTPVCAANAVRIMSELV
ncbi:MAG: adaptor protein MecA [Ruminiclostridium sp.]|nr:adaptor protein MecA [Ruminiclostridium sp.]